jgi:hypothetical protein
VKKSIQDFDEKFSKITWVRNSTKNWVSSIFFWKKLEPLENEYLNKSNKTQWKASQID